MPRYLDIFISYTDECPNENTFVNEKKKKKKEQNFLNPGFPGGLVVKNLPANAGDMGLIPGLGRSHMPQSS